MIHQMESLTHLKANVISWLVVVTNATIKPALNFFGLDIDGTTLDQFVAIMQIVSLFGATFLSVATAIIKIREHIGVKKDKTNH